MDKKGKIYIGLTILVVVLIVILEYNKPQELNWFPSYAKHHKIPFGSYVLHEQLERIFTKENIIDVERPPFEYLNKNTINGTYFFMNADVTFDKAELDKLLSWTAKGNTLAIASETISSKILDTLNLERSFVSNFDNIKNQYQFHLEERTLKTNEKYRFDKANFVYYFNKIDSLNTTVIGQVSNVSETDSVVNKRYTNVIKQPFGDGEIIINLFPQAYTNYFMLEEPNYNYTAGLLSYINPNETIYFDNHYKSGKKIATSPLYVFLKAKELKWAYYIMLIGVLFYILFEGKRKQRAIPVVKPLRNQTLDFTRTIANMYYENSKHQDIAQHKIQHFMDYIRTQLHLNTNSIDEAFLKNLAARSNNDFEATKTLFKTIENISNQKNISKEALEKLNTLIEKFKSHNTWKTKS
ncbi:DUF4350 domain-containing protein [Lacinutrix sp. 5H-3-7-4]|uniref:DUF4350 domain-containing protein n=1 Tax=Lacinutrix sp. (strain 5H-3-7-4) TaxID=983544 RepID=UPI00020A34C8|nr:DUF4350 domain-containing protein [Lacinutrix sp. 5H-3-7-4]AEH01766.1 hypothetical protein Lacal_1920 [Lacinutrix sp. 5H-3-7-4]